MLGKDYLCNGSMLVISYDLLSRKEAELLKKEYKVGGKRTLNQPNLQ